jgi:hypothetical protein
MSGDFDDMDCIYKKRDLISYILQVGEARQMISDLLNNDDFNNIGKHSIYWESEHTPEDEKLEDARFTLQFIHSKLSDIMEKLD